MQKLIRNNLRLFLTISIACLLISCSNKNYPYKKNYNTKSSDSIPNYSNLYYWAAHPWKWDPGDSIPKPLRKNYIKDSVVDVFFIHPTTFTDYSIEKQNAFIDDSMLNAKTDYTTILYQASVFNEECRVFSPRYRQAHLRAFYNKKKYTRLYSFRYCLF